MKYHQNDSPVSVGPLPSEPFQLSLPILSPCSPNPFNPTTTIRYTLPHASHVTLKIYDILGRVVSELVNGTQEAGYKSVQFKANDLPSGIYFYRLQAGAFVEEKKLLLLK